MVNGSAEDLIKAVKVPKLILLGRKALADDPERVKEALRAINLAGVFVASDIDAMVTQNSEISPNIMGLHQAFAVVADFPFEIALVIEGGEVVEGNLPEVQTDPEEPATVN
jgi:hypothetical protein